MTLCFAAFVTSVAITGTWLSFFGTQVAQVQILSPQSLNGFGPAKMKKGQTLKLTTWLAVGTLIAASHLASAADPSIPAHDGASWQVNTNTIEGTEYGLIGAWVWATYPSVQPGPSWDGRAVQFDQSQNYWIFDCRWKKSGVLRTIYYREEKMQLYSSREDQRKEILKLVGLNTSEAALLHWVCLQVDLMKRATSMGQ